MDYFDEDAEEFLTKVNGLDTVFIRRFKLYYIEKG